MTTGVYTLTASTTDTNYQLLDDQRTIIMKKKEVKVEGMITLSKEYDSTDIYPYELIEGIHYFVDGIVDDAQVILGDKIYNSPDVDFATSVTVWISITDTDNYTIEESFEFEALISPKPTQVFWSHQDEYTYNGEDFGDTVSAYYLNVAGEEVLPIIAFSGESTVFMTAGYYTVTATTEDTNYQLTQAQIELYIDKAQHDMSNILFEDKQVTYNAVEHTLVISGTLPQGVNVEYTDNKGINVGEYQAKATFVYDEHNYHAIEDMTATLTIVRRDITVSFSDYEDLIYDGSVKSVGVVLNNIPDEEEDLSPIITYNKEVLNPGRYTVTVTINNDNYNLVGKNSLDFILYLDKLENQDQVGNKDVIAFADKGFLPEADIDVVNLHQRKPLTVGKFAGKEIRQNVFIRIIDDESRNEYMTMRILIHPDFRYLENLWVGMLQEDGSIVEIESHREGDYLVFKAYDQDATYVVIGDGKGEAVWTVPVVASSAGILILSIVGIGIRSKRRKRLKQRIIGQ
jgi:hypothetical protein